MRQGSPLRAIRHQPSLTERAAEDLRRAIQDGHYGETGRLPSEPDLARQLGVSRATLRHAISVLQEEGLVQRRHGSGTFVTGRAAELRNNLSVNFGVSDLIEAAGWHPGTRDLVVEEGRADQETSSRLDIPPRSRLLLVHRTRTADGRPVAFTTDMVPASRFADAFATVEALHRAIEADGSLYRVLEGVGIIVNHGIAEMKPARADRRLSAALEVPFGALLLELDQVDATSDGEAILRSREWFLADAFRFHVYRKDPEVVCSRMDVGTPGFIFMLTRADVTIADAVEVYEREVRPTGVGWVGFKDVGPDIGVLERLAATIRADGRTCVLEVVSIDEDAERRSVQTGIDIGVDVIMGGTHPRSSAELLAGTDVAYFPFPGTVVGHPSVLEGSVDEIVASAASIAATPGVHGLDLLAFRSTGDPLGLVRSVVEAVPCPVVVAGSIDGPARIRDVLGAGAHGFTIGSAILDGTFAPGIGVRASIEEVLAVVADERPAT